MDVKIEHVCGYGACVCVRYDSVDIEPMCVLIVWISSLFACVCVLMDGVDIKHVCVKKCVYEACLTACYLP